nr:hypothetical protein [Klebsiella pneumoniae]
MKTPKITGTETRTTIKFNLAVFFIALFSSNSEKIEGNVDVINEFNIKDHDVANEAATEYIPTAAFPSIAPNVKRDNRV